KAGHFGLEFQTTTTGTIIYLPSSMFHQESGRIIWIRRKQDPGQAWDIPPPETDDILHYKILLYLVMATALAQPLKAQKPDLQGMTTDQLQAWIQTTKGGQKSAEIVASIFNTGRKELIAKCYEFPVTASSMRELVVKLPDSPEKDAIVISILRCNSPYFPKKPNPYVADVRQGSIEPWPIEPFRSVIKKWLPEEKLDKSIMNTPEARQLLAAKLEAAIDGKPLPGPTTENTSKPANPGTNPESAAGKWTQKPADPDATATPINPEGGSQSWWLPVLLGLIVLSLLVRWKAKAGRQL
ncbi:MAG: hypothetical protein JWL81_3047, partial [Verrucomicrobiales bacterium]|nr:hypothetical protein [Verrucomicrobiales bacterium]